MTYPEMLDRYHIITDVTINPELTLSEGYRQRLILERQQLLTALVAAGIIDNSH